MSHSRNFQAYVFSPSVWMQAMDTTSDAVTDGSNANANDSSQNMSSTVVVLEEGTTAPASTIFHLNLFRTLGNVQSAHGIPLLDYAQYHAYCTKRLHRIRHHRDVRSQLVHSIKYRKQQNSNSTQPQHGGGDNSSNKKGGKSKGPTGGRHGFCPQPPVPENGVIQHDYILWNLVFQAERAWAVACSLQGNNSASGNRIISAKSSSAGNNDNNNTKAKSKSHILSRFNKAVHWARILEEIVTKNSCVTYVTQREINSYFLWMIGNQQLQREDYAAAFRHFSESRKILLELAAMPASTSHDSNAAIDNEAAPTTGSVLDAEQVALQDMWTNRANNLLLPLIRYCQYEAKDEELVQPEETTDSSSPVKKKESNSIFLEFRNKRIALDAYPQLALLYLKLEKHISAGKSVGGGDEDIDNTPMSEADFLQCLSDLDDALRLSAQELQRYQDLPDGPAVQGKRRELASLKAFFQYHKLSLQRRHQEDRLESSNVFTADAAEMVHVYEALLQNAQAMADLNQDDDDSDYNPEDDPLWLEAQAHVVRIRSLRCFHLARLYESPVYLTGTTTAQVLALLQQCSRLQRRAEEEVLACEFRSKADEERYQKQLESLKIHLQATMARVSAVRFLEQREAASALSKATNRPLWLRLRDLDAGTVLADQNPSPVLLPIPCKPVFYDVAWEHVTETLSSTQILDKCIALNEPKKKSGPGLFGWFSGGS
ncbi:hypothetical protein ACA910_013160 [Epithemia clementina (nom. ined.)]